MTTVKRLLFFLVIGSFFIVSLINYQRNYLLISKQYLSQEELKQKDKIIAKIFANREKINNISLQPYPQFNNTYKMSFIPDEFELVAVSSDSFTIKVTGKEDKLIMSCLTTPLAKAEEILNSFYIKDDNLICQDTNNKHILMNNIENLKITTDNNATKALISFKPLDNSNQYKDLIINLRAVNNSHATT